MEDELEGIELETINPDGIDLSEEDVELEEAEIEETEIEQDETQVEDTKTEKEKSLQKGVNEERRKRKEAERKNKELEARIRALEATSKATEKTTADELIEAGIDESIAKSIALAIDKKNSDSKTKQELADLKFEMSLTKKSKEEGFEDILDYADEIKELVDKGLTLEQSYYATTFNKTQRTANTKSEIERKLEAKMQNQQARKEILGNNISSNSGVANSSKTKIKATATEKAMAAAAGMSVAEYVAVRDMNSVKDYTNYKAKQK